MELIIRYSKIEDLISCPDLTTPNLPLACLLTSRKFEGICNSSEMHNDLIEILKIRIKEQIKGQWLQVEQQYENNIKTNLDNLEENESHKNNSKI